MFPGLVVLLDVPARPAPAAASRATAVRAEQISQLVGTAADVIATAARGPDAPVATTDQRAAGR